jgi:three-Cys-motif partner protein
MSEDRLDIVGYWTEIKLSILQDYASAYAQILSKQSAIKHFAFIDGFAGAGTHVAKSTGQEIDGSPAIALDIRPPFPHYHFIDLDGKRAARLRQRAGDRQDISVYEGDCNKILLDKVFPICRYEDYRRALCLLDPYGLNPDWKVIETAGRMRSIEIFLNFMIMDVNRNVLLWNPDNTPPAQAKRMNAFWGDDSWLRVAYTKEPGLFGDIEERRPKSAIAITNAYRKRLTDIAGFKYVPEPMPMRNSKGAVIYYLFFASPNETGHKIIKDIFRKYQDMGAVNGH